jgi:hypothetical protein
MPDECHLILRRNASPSSSRAKNKHEASWECLSWCAREHRHGYRLPSTLLVTLSTDPYQRLPAGPGGPGPHIGRVTTPHREFLPVTKSTVEQAKTRVELQRPVWMNAREHRRWAIGKRGYWSFSATWNVTLQHPSWCTQWKGFWALDAEGSPAHPTLVLWQLRQKFHAWVYWLGGQFRRTQTMDHCSCSNVNWTEALVWDKVTG